MEGSGQWSMVKGQRSVAVLVSALCYIFIYFYIYICIHKYFFIFLVLVDFQIHRWADVCFCSL